MTRSWIIAQQEGEFGTRDLNICGRIKASGRDGKCRDKKTKRSSKLFIMAERSQVYEAIKASLYCIHDLCSCDLRASD